MSKKTLPMIITALFFVALFVNPATALDRVLDEQDRAVNYKHRAPTMMTLEEAEEYERLIPADAELSPTLDSDDGGFVPGGEVIQNVQAFSGRFCGIGAGNTNLDAQHFGSTQRMIQVRPATGLSSFVHCAWMVLKSEELTDPDRQINYNCYDWGAGGGPTWTLGSGDSFGGISIIEAGERGGYTHIDINESGNAVVFHHSEVIGASNYSRIVRFANPGLGTYVDDYLTSLAGQENIWPSGTIGHRWSDDKDIYHVGALDSNPGEGNLAVQAYWRYAHDGAVFVWEGPVPMDSTMVVSHQVLAVGERVVFIFAKPRSYVVGKRNQYDNDLVYYESTTNGADWINNGGPMTTWENGGAWNCTDYIDDDIHRHYIDVAAGFDAYGGLHIIYNPPGYDDDARLISVGPNRLLHWDEGSTPNANAIVSPGTDAGFDGGTDANFNTVAVALWGEHSGYGEANDGWCGRWNRNISKMSIAFGDGSTDCNGGSNTDYVYCVYTQFGSENPNDKEDASDAGYQNGNLWMSISNDEGFSWAGQKCITTTDCSVGGTPTRSPGCDVTNVAFDDTCLSEHWGSIAGVINDTMHVFYIGDIDAGGIPQSEGSWATADVMYMPVFGGTDGDLCPTIAPVLLTSITGDPNCEYYSDLNEEVNSEDLKIGNIGNATLTYSIDINYLSGSGWLSIDGGQTVPETTIPKGGSDDDYLVEMDGGGLAKGLYQAEIEVQNDDLNKGPTFVMPIDFFRADSFICGTGVVVTTPCVALEVSNVESFGREGLGMRYYAEPDDDSNYNPLFDGSLIIANKTLTGGVDTIVYRDIFSNQTPSNPGFRGLEYPRLSYNAATDESLVTANQVTVDSTLGVTAQYIFPQSSDSCEYVRINYKIYPYVNEDPNVVIGLAADFDIPGGYPGTGIGFQNLGGYVEDYNLVYQHGTDTVRIGGGPDDLIAVTNKYVAGITALSCMPAKSLQVGNNPDHIYPRHGFTDGYLFTSLGANGAYVWADSAEDLHTILSVQEVSLAEGDFTTMQVALVSSLAGAEGVEFGSYTYPYDGYVTDLIETTKKAWKKGFGWAGDFAYENLESVDQNGAIDFIATGTHEDGISGGCCGCNFELTNVTGPSPAAVSLVDNGDCTGYVKFTDAAVGTYSLTLTVEDGCAEQSDVIVLSGIEVISSDVICGDLTCDGAVNPVDVMLLMNYHYQNVNNICDLGATDIIHDDCTSFKDLLCMLIGLYKGHSCMTTSECVSGNPPACGPCPNSGAPDMVTITSTEGEPGEIVSVQVSAGSDINGDYSDLEFYYEIPIEADSRLTFYDGWYHDGTPVPERTDGKILLFGNGIPDLSGLIGDMGPTPQAGTGMVATLRFRIALDAEPGFALIDLTTIDPTIVPAFYNETWQCSSPNFVINGAVKIAGPECGLSRPSRWCASLSPAANEPITILLRNSADDPLTGVEGVYLDFSDCSSGELIPCGDYPDWPLVYGVESDENGEVEFFIGAAGNCPDCVVDVHIPGCSNPLTIPVHTFDIDGDGVAGAQDWNDGLPSSECINFDCLGDGGDGNDLAIFSPHMNDECPTTPDDCDNLVAQIEIVPDADLLPGDFISVTYKLTNTSTAWSCDLTSLDLAWSPFGPGLAYTQIGSTQYPGITLGPGEVYTFTYDNFEVPPLGAVDQEVGIYLRGILETVQCDPDTTHHSIFTRLVCKPGEIICLESSFALPSGASIQYIDGLPTGWSFSTGFSSGGDSVLVAVCTDQNSQAGDAATVHFWLMVGGERVPPDPVITVRHTYSSGDCNSDCRVNPVDVVLLVNYVYKGLADPNPWRAGNLRCPNGLGIINPVDVVWMVNYVYKQPALPPEDCPDK